MKTFFAALKKHWRKFFLGCVTFLGVLFLNSWWMVRSTDTHVFKDTTQTPSNNVGLVLGTSPRLKNGAMNWHFKVRMDAAAKLFKKGKVKHLLLSGDNHTLGYDEPTEMKKALLERGIPESAMTLDFAGFRTLDSVVRAHAIFGQEKVTIVTEDFHAHRSAFLAQHFGLDAIVFCAEPLGARWTVRMQIRELGARGKAALDAHVLHTQPHFLGDKVEIKLGSSEDIPAKG